MATAEPQAFALEACAESDAILAKFTILRYLVVGIIVFYKVSRKMECTASDDLKDRIEKFYNAAIDFLSSDGVGLFIYFTVSALMDNVAIFFVHSDGYCGYVKMVAIYSMALVTFLPTCWFASAFQANLWDK